MFSTTLSTCASKSRIDDDTRATARVSSVGKRGRLRDAARRFVVRSTASRLSAVEGGDVIWKKNIGSVGAPVIETTLLQCRGWRLPRG